MYRSLHTPRVKAFWPYISHFSHFCDKKQLKEGRVGFGSWFEGLHHGEESAVTGTLGDGHITSPARRQGEMNTGAEFAFLFLLSSFIEWSLLHPREVFSSQLNLSGNTFVDMPQGVSPR